MEYFSKNNSDLDKSRNYPHLRSYFLSRLFRHLASSSALQFCTFDVLDYKQLSLNRTQAGNVWCLCYSECYAHNTLFIIYVITVPFACVHSRSFVHVCSTQCIMFIAHLSQRDHCNRLLVHPFKYWPAIKHAVQSITYWGIVIIISKTFLVEMKSCSCGVMANTVPSDLMCQVSRTTSKHPYFPPAKQTIYIISDWVTSFMLSWAFFN